MRRMSCLPRRLPGPRKELLVSLSCRILLLVPDWVAFSKVCRHPKHLVRGCATNFDRIPCCEFAGLISDNGLRAPAWLNRWHVVFREDMIPSSVPASHQDDSEGRC